MATAGVGVAPAPATSATSVGSAGPAVSTEVLGGIPVVALAIAPLLFGLPHDRTVGEALLPLLTWPAVGLAGLVLLDRRRGSRRGWICVLVTPVPCWAVLLTAAARGGGLPDGVAAVAAAGDAWGPGIVTFLALVVAAPPDDAGSGAPARAGRRWRLWTTVACASTVLVSWGTWWAGLATASGVAGALGVGAVAAVVATSTVAREPRPVSEPLLDAVLCLLVVVSGGAVGALVLAFARQESIFAPEVLGVLSAVATVALSAPAALWAHRELARRRYGSGTIAPQDVAAINQVLVGEAEPRELLARATTVLRGLSGVRDVQLLLDSSARPGWTPFPLRVGEETVGTLLVRPTDPDGLEDRQSRTLDQLLPTLALAVRAVSLAIDARHAQEDALRQRERERARILADLHDDLGPVLVGMGMQVEALLTARPSPELRALASDLAGCRADLRRIVENLSPPALVGDDLPDAIDRLVASFGPAPDVEVRVTHPVPSGVAGPTALTIYRIVAEAVTNAVRHGRPSRVEVSVRRRDGALHVCVRDDGTDAVILPGRGLTSLRARAERLGGSLDVTSLPTVGTTLRARVPEPP